jgi:hypothetical protein
VWLGPVSLAVSIPFGMWRPDVSSFILKKRSIQPGVACSPSRNAGHGVMAGCARLNLRLFISVKSLIYCVFFWLSTPCFH